MKRTDDYQKRREHLASLTDKEIEQRFWQLTDRLVSPLVEMGRTHTTPSIERSVLLRMGFSSLEVKPIVDGCIEHNLIGYGAGNVVYRLSKHLNVSIRQAGLMLCQGKEWDTAQLLFEGEE